MHHALDPQPPSLSLNLVNKSLVIEGEDMIKDEPSLDLIQGMTT